MSAGDRRLLLLRIGLFFVGIWRRGFSAFLGCHACGGLHRGHCQRLFQNVCNILHLPNPETEPLKLPRTQTSRIVQIVLLPLVNQGDSLVGLTFLFMQEARNLKQATSFWCLLVVKVLLKKQSPKRDLWCY